VVLALAADHVMRDACAFVAACRQGLVAAEQGRIVTFGVKAGACGHRIRLHQPGRGGSGEVRAVAKFVEKPDPAQAANTSRRAISGTAATSCSALRLAREYRKLDAKRAGSR